jgi:hypothetical protein
MNLAGYFRDLEAQIGASFSDLFYEFLDDFSQMLKREGFNSLFKQYHFCTASEIMYATRNLIPDEFLPFFVEQHDEYKDYYCFEKANSKNSTKLIVFSRDGIVQEWQNQSEFISWLQSRT